MAEQELSKERLAELKDELSKLLAMDRYTVVSRYPFIGGILMHLTLIPVRDRDCPTACTDGKNVFFDIAFYSGLNESERVFVLAHETWHCVMLHILRRNGRIPLLWNIAIDMEVNNIINQSCSDYIFKPPQDALFPPTHLKDHSAEEIYEYLLQQSNQSSQSSKSGQSDYKSSKSQGNSSGQSNSQNSLSSIQQKNKNRKGSSSSKLEGQFDEHKENSDENLDGGSGNEEVKDKYGKVGKDPDFTPKSSPSYADDIRDAVISEAQKCERQQGKLPSYIKKLIEKYRTPEIKWEDELAKFVTPIFGGRRQWLPPQRRHIYNEMYFQSRRSERIDVVVVIDTSGSCLDDLPKFFTELCGLINTFGHYRLMVIQCDCQVSDVQEYDSEGELFDPNTKFETSGGGGTSFCPPFDYLKEKGITPECLVYFTDGYGDAPSTPPGYPVLWIITSDGTREFCKWGKKVKFKSENKKENDSW